MARERILFGAGGHAKVVAEAWQLASPGHPLKVIDDAPGKIGGSVLGHPVVGDRAWLQAHGGSFVAALGVGHGPSRAMLAEWATAQEIALATVIHPAAIVSDSVATGAGAFIAAGAVVISGASIGGAAIVNTRASVDHDCIVGFAAHVAPGATLCGGVRVGARTLIGAGATVIPGIRIGDDAVIGAGSVVLRDVPAGARVAGNPARPL